MNKPISFDVYKPGEAPHNIVVDAEEVTALEIGAGRYRGEDKEALHPTTILYLTSGQTVTVFGDLTEIMKRLDLPAV